jgi:hypothetical protein
MACLYKGKFGIWKKIRITQIETNYVYLEISPPDASGASGWDLERAFETTNFFPL